MFFLALGVPQNLSTYIENLEAVCGFATVVKDSRQKSQIVHLH